MNLKGFSVVTVDECRGRTYEWRIDDGNEAIRI